MNAIKQILHDEYLTQNEVARRMGITQIGLSTMLNHNMSLRSFEKICEVIGVEVILRKGEREYEWKSY